MSTTTMVLLQQQYEMAKLQAQKDVPIVRILDSPSAPTLKSGPYRMINIGLSGVISLVLVVLFVIGSDMVKQTIRGSRRSSLDLLTAELANTFPRASKLYNSARDLVSRNTASVDR